jgi:hypothetical protein
MQIWNDFVDWFNSAAGQRIITSTILPFVAIILAGLIAAAIGRGSAKRVIALSDREEKSAAVMALISAARKAAVWNTISAPEQSHVTSLIGEADIRLRLLPLNGTALAADWAQHEIAEMQKNAVSFSFQAEQGLINFRDRMIEWQTHPGRAKRLFKNDLDSWAYESSLEDQELVHQQQAWAAQQADTGTLDAYAAPDPATKTEPAAKTEAISGTEPTTALPSSSFSRPAVAPASDADHGAHTGPTPVAEPGVSYASDNTKH